MASGGRDETPLPPGSFPKSPSTSPPRRPTRDTADAEPAPPPPKLGPPKQASRPQQPPRPDPYAYLDRKKPYSYHDPRATIPIRPRQDPPPYNHPKKKPYPLLDGGFRDRFSPIRDKGPNYGYSRGAKGGQLTSWAAQRPQKPSGVLKIRKPASRQRGQLFLPIGTRQSGVVSENQKPAPRRRGPLYSPINPRKGRLLREHLNTGRRQIIEGKDGERPVIAKDVPASSKADVMIFLKTRLNCEHLVRLVDIDGFAEDSLGPKRQFFEWCDYGNLQERLDKVNGKGLPEDLIWHVLLSLLKAILYLQHGQEWRPELFDKMAIPKADFKPIVHHFINPTSVFFQSREKAVFDGRPRTGTNETRWPNVKLGNFSRAVFLKAWETQVYDDASQSFVSKEDRTNFEAPEISWEEDLHPIGNAADVWSIGMIGLAMMGSNVMSKGNVDDPDARNPMASIIKNYQLEFWPAEQMPQEYSSNLRNFLEDLLAVKPYNRPEPFEAIDHCRWAFWKANEKRLQTLFEDEGGMPDDWDESVHEQWQRENEDYDARPLRNARISNDFWTLHEAMFDEDFEWEEGGLEKAQKQIDERVEDMLENDLIGINPWPIWTHEEPPTAAVLKKDYLGRLVLDDLERVMIDEVLADDPAALSGWEVEVEDDEMGDTVQDQTQDDDETGDAAEDQTQEDDEIGDAAEDQAQEDDEIGDAVVDQTQEGEVEVEKDEMVDEEEEIVDEVEEETVNEVEEKEEDEMGAVTEQTQDQHPSQDDTTAAPPAVMPQPASTGTAPPLAPSAQRGERRSARLAALAKK